MSSNGSGSKRLRIARRAIRRMEPFDRLVENLIVIQRTCPSCASSTLSVWSRLYPME